MTILITGGAKNGKSSLAQTLALTLAKGGTHYYVATMIPADAEDDQRIRLHLLDREGMGFETIECGRHILDCLNGADKSGTFLLDSVTALLLNELFPDPTSCNMDLTAPERCAGELEAFVSCVDNAVIVSDYIYSDAMRYDQVTEQYRKGLALIDKTLARVCDTVIEVVAENLVVHKGALPQ